MLLHVIYLVLQQIFQAVRLHGVVPSTVLLHWTEEDGHSENTVKNNFSHVKTIPFTLCGVILKRVLKVSVYITPHSLLQIIRFSVNQYYKHKAPTRDFKSRTTLKHGGLSLILINERESLV